MKKRTMGAERLEWGYLTGLKESLKSSDPQEANEVVQFVRRVTENRLASLVGEEVSEEQMKEILEGMGSPESQREKILAGKSEGAPLESREVPEKEKDRKKFPRRALSLGRLLALMLILVSGLFVYTLYFKKPLVSSPGKLRALTMSPSGEVQTDQVSSLEISFDGPLDSQTIKEDAIKLHPSAKGRVKLKGKKTLVFQLREKLRRATPYRLSLSPHLKGTRGELLSAEAFSFHTPALALEKITQSGVQRGSVTLSLKFNGPVNPQELEKHLKIHSPEGNRMDYSFLSSKGSSLLRLRVWNRSYEQFFLKIAKDLVGTEGPLGLKESVQKPLKISLKLRFFGMVPDYQGSKPYISLRTNAPLDALEARGYIKTTPPVDLTFDSSYEGLRVWGAFEPGKRYLVTLKKGLSAGAAGNLEKDYERVVWFGDCPESLELAFRGKYLSPRGLMKLPLRSVNVKKVNLKIERLYESNLVEYALRSDNDRPRELGKEILKKELSLQGDKNKEVETLLDLRSLTGEKKLGVVNCSRR